ncbi:MAG: hypothetical protein U0894_10745 [Pirellulales bacterium]
MLHTRLRCCLCSFCLLLVTGFLFGPAAFAQATKPIPLQPITPARAKAEWAMQQPYSANYVDTPLSEVLDEIRNKFGVNVYIAERQLKDSGVELDQVNITCNLQDVALESFLQAVLDEFGLMAFCNNEAICVSVPVHVEGQLEVVVYPVGDLIEWQRYKYAKDRATPNAENLIVGITSTISPNSWDEVGGPGSLHFDRESLSLVVSQAQPEQKSVERYFAALRESKRVQQIRSSGPSPQLSPSSSAISRLRSSSSAMDSAGSGSSRYTSANASEHRGPASRAKVDSKNPPGAQSRGQ